jgi:hypothetical protein
VRYAASSDPIDAGYCHCRICQRASGAPVLAWASFPVASFAYEKGDVGAYRSSDHGVREFCRDCGTQLLFRDDRTPQRVDLNLASLDEPAALVPEYHIWTASRIPWFNVVDDLPRYADDGPDAVGP